MFASVALRVAAMLAVVISVAPSTAFGQGNRQPASVVQLPTFNFFTVSTTVMAPDRGAISLGGVRSLREGSVSRGVPMLSKIPGLSRLGKNVGIGREASASGLSVHPTIINREEMEAALMADAAASRVVEPAMVAFRESIAEAARLSGGIASATPLAATPTPAPAATRSTPPGLAEIRRRNAVASRAKMDEAMQHFRRGERAMDEGKAGVAKIYYRMAAKSGNDELKKVVAQRMKQLQQQRQEQQ